MDRSTVEKSALVFLVLLLSILLIGAFTDEPEPEDLCKFIDPVSIERAVGVGMAPEPQQIETLYGGKITIVTCRYRPAEGDRGVVMQVRLQPGTPQVEGGQMPPVDRVRRIADPKATLTDYRGIADGLVWNDLAREVVMFKNDSVFFFRVTGVPDEELEKRTVDLSILVASRLDQVKPE